MNAVIIVALGIIVLVVLIYIFTRNTGGAADTARSCSAVGGTCTPSLTCPEGQTGNVYLTGDCKGRCSNPAACTCCRPSGFA